MINRIHQQQHSCSTQHQQRDRGANHESIGTLLKDLTDETRTLLRQEVELAKAEIGEKASRIGRNITYLLIGAFVAHAALLTMIAAASFGLADILNQNMATSTAVWVGTLIVGVVVAIIGYALIQKAITTLKHESLVPRKTMQSLRENTEWLKDQMTTSENRMKPASATIR